MIDPSAKLSVSRQAIVLGISRGSVYYQPRPEKKLRALRFDAKRLRTSTVFASGS